MIGQLRTRLGIYRPTYVPDALGGNVVSWVFWGPCWASIKTLSARKKADGDRAAMWGVYKVIIRYRTGFPPKARLLWGERVLKVVSYSDPDGRRERLHLICEEERS